MRETRSICRVFLLKLATLLLTTVLLIVLPLSFILFIPLFFYRYFVKVLAPLWNPKLAKMLTTRSSTMASDTITMFSNPMGNIVVQVKMEGKVDPERLKGILKDKVLDARLTNGELKYPELRQFLTSWGGYYFWEEDEDFDIENHVQYRDIGTSFLSKVFHGKQLLDKIGEEELQEPWEKGRPLWKVLLIDVHPTEDAVGVPQTVMFFKMHHCVADGYSILQLVIKHIVGMSMTKSQNPTPSYAKRSCWRDVLFWTALPFRLPYEVANMLLVTSGCSEEIPFKVPYTRQSGTFLLQSTVPIPLQQVKAIKNHFRVGFNAVLLAVVTGALRELMISKRGPVSKIFPFAIPLPLKNHPDKLRNYIGGGYANLPTGVQDLTTRLRECQREILRLKESTFPVLAYLIFLLVGALPGCMIRAFMRNYAPLWFTSFPGGKAKLSIDNVPMSGIAFFVGLMRGCTGLGISVLSYQKELVFSVVGDAQVFTRSDMEEITANIEAQFGLLMHKGQRDV